MDKELKAKWIAALRSGEYKQCTQDLCNGEAYCCLGVLHRIVYGKDPGSAWYGYSSDSEESGAIVKRELPDGVRGSLIDMNDGGKTFPEIADYIEANL